ncbi:MAG: hypothetical protein CMJ78_07970 [Planctomycetaceae bacterium]|nr:hypothetical protein [Planctomycetaceae bacterium]
MWLQWNSYHWALAAIATELHQRWPATTPLRVAMIPQQYRDQAQLARELQSDHILQPPSSTCSPQDSVLVTHWFPRHCHHQLCSKSAARQRPDSELAVDSHPARTPQPTKRQLPTPPTLKDQRQHDHHQTASSSGQVHDPRAALNVFDSSFELTGAKTKPLARPNRKYPSHPPR